MTKIIIGLVALGALIGLWYVVPSLKNNNDDIYVFVESGRVFTKANKDAEYSQVNEKKVSVKTGSFVKTEIGIAHILFPNNSEISLGENSEMEIKYAAHSVSISQLVGDSYSRVEKLVSGDTYEVYTGGTLAAVRGTKFAVRYDAKTKKAKVAVTENTVEVSRLLATSSTPTKVTVGMLANVDENINPTPGKQLVAVSQTKYDTSMNSWLERNALLDEFMDANPRNFFENLIKTDASGTDVKSLRGRLEKAKSLANLSESKMDDTKKVSLKSLLAMGTTQKCTYSYSSNGVTSSADVYLSNGKMRTDSTMVEGGKTMQNHMILMNETSYVWGDGMAQGIKMSVANASVPNASNQAGSAQSVDMTAEMNYSCTPWSTDAKIFELPPRITFVDLSQMMQQAMPKVKASAGATTGSVDLCASCSSLTEPALSQCKAALGCR